ncbi:MAG TPA: hypothetical protein VMW24_22245 [Sedimentisphaerales bacterium]|nr:hypothetical protein [Sedimentisphaerales bacterium]
MPDEREDLTGSDVQSQQDAGTADADTTNQDAQADDATNDGAAGSEQDPKDYRAEYEKLQREKTELQSQFTTVSQDAAKARQMLEAVQPYVDYSRAQQQAGQQADAGQGDSDDEEYLTKKQVQEFVANTVKGVREEIIAQRVRSQYSDVCDNDWKEKIVLNELAKLAKTHPYEDPEQRIKRAVETARNILKGVQEEGRKQAEADSQKAQAEAKKKAAAAAAASGLEATGVTSPATKESGTEEQTGPSYIQNRRDRREATRNISS